MFPFHSADHALLRSSSTCQLLTQYEFTASIPLISVASSPRFAAVVVVISAAVQKISIYSTTLMYVNSTVLSSTIFSVYIITS